MHLTNALSRIEDPEKCLAERVEEMAVEQYDIDHRHDGDMHDEETGLKVKGMCDQDKLQRWQSVLEKTMKRRIARNREKKAD